MAKKILIIEDDLDMITFLSTLLEDHGYETISAVNGEEGLEKIKSDKPDLISLDLLMPNKTGIKLFREIRREKETAEIPVIMVTGLGKGDVPQMDFKEWIQKRSVRPPEAYIEKPVDQEVYLNAIKKAIG
jgi:CheY-like chemotaxis protein